MLVLLSNQFLFGQKLQLDDILTSYKLDSISLKSFSKEKQFDLTKITEDNWIFSYNFQSTSDKKISFARTFPKDRSDNIYLYYYFDDKKDYQNFKDSLKSKGFKKSESYNIFPKNVRTGDFRESYTNDTLKLELSTSNFEKTKWALLLSKKSNLK